MGYSASIGLLALGMILYAILSTYYYFVNKRRREGKEDYKIVGMTDAEIDALGENSPRFVYTL
jgi:cbb3-type cytochrome oxidase subunit 3